jgi:hypothetical protein
VAELHEQPIRKTPQLPPSNQRKQHKLKLEKHYREYKRAEQKGDIVRIATGLGAMVHEILSTSIEYGIPMNKVFNEIHRSKVENDCSQVENILAPAMYEDER